MSTADPDRDPEGPRTRASLARDLARLGVRSGQTLLVHSSLRSLGWVCGSEQAVVQALTDALGPDGTLVVPTQTSDNTDPSGWGAPPVPASWWPTIREHTPAFDPLHTPGSHMGRISEAVRTRSGAVRSPHPQTSFAALGPDAEQLMYPHPLGCALGERSPLARLEQQRAHILLLGVGYDSCTAFHLAEYRLPNPRRAETSCAIGTEHGRREWVTVTDVDLDADDFPTLGTALEETGIVTTGPVGAATARLFPLAEAVGFATSWLNEHRAR
ncbi:aminoglycoside N(3)-acetyltransferase [Nocardiopsis alba]|uniref:aminoglycoside N(3)-acetyltransferase n=1 Tax=Nocardiopsis alba TaxID=53437 RepID=UPI0035DCE3FC